MQKKGKRDVKDIKVFTNEELEIEENTIIQLSKENIEFLKEFREGLDVIKDECGLELKCEYHMGKDGQLYLSMEELQKDPEAWKKFKKWSSEFMKETDE